MMHGETTRRLALRTSLPPRDGQAVHELVRAGRPLAPTERGLQINASWAVIARP